MIPETFSAARSMLSPRVFGAERFELDKFELGVSGRKSGLEAVRVGGPGVLVGVVVDDGAAEFRVSEPMARGWGLSFDEVLSLALSNAAQRGFQVESVADSLFLVRDPAFDPRVWLEPELLVKFPIRGVPVVVTPLRGFTLVGRDRPETLTLLAGVMGDMLEAGHALESVTVCRRNGQVWEPVDWATSKVAPALISRVTRLFAHQSYARQKPLLEADSAQSQDVFVATHKVFRAPDGRVVSRATWSEGVPTLLPVVDEVNLTTANLSGLSVTWDRLAAAAAHMMQPCGLIPERFLVVGFPPPETIATLTTVVSSGCAPREDQRGAHARRREPRGRLQVAAQLEALIVQRDADVSRAMADYAADGVSDEYRAKEQRWHAVADQVKQIIGTLRGSLEESGQIAGVAARQAAQAVANIG